MCSIGRRPRPPCILIQFFFANSDTPNDTKTFPPRSPPSAPPLYRPPYRFCRFLVGCYVPPLIGGHLKATMYFNMIFFVVAHFDTPNDTTTFPPRSPPSAPPLYRNLFRIRRLLVGCCVVPSIGGHLRSRPCLPLNISIGLVLAPQTGEPTAALPNPMASALHGPIGSGGAMSWGHRCSTHGGRGRRRPRVEWPRFCCCCVCCGHKQKLLYALVVTVLQYFKVLKMSFGEESTRTDRPNFPPQRSLTKSILTARK